MKKKHPIKVGVFLVAHTCADMYAAIPYAPLIVYLNTSYKGYELVKQPLRVSIIVVVTLRCHGRNVISESDNLYDN